MSKLTDFEKNYWDKISKEFPLALKANGNISIQVANKGLVEYNPESNELVIKKPKRVVKNGLKWILRQLKNQ